MNDTYSIIVAYSILQLPESTRQRKDFYEKLIESGKDIHFACENLAIEQSKLTNSLKAVELIICCYDATKNLRIRAK